jgi:hypothetical protein
VAIYPYKCSGCGDTKEVVQSIASYSISPVRPQCCAGEMARVFTVPMIAPDMPAFVSHVDGTVINSRSEHREYLKRTGMVMYDEIAPDLPRRRQETIDAGFKDLKDDVAEAVLKLEQGYKPRQEVKAEVLDAETLDVDVRGGLEVEATTEIVT